MIDTEHRKRLAKKKTSLFPTVKSDLEVIVEVGYNSAHFSIKPSRIRNTKFNFRGMHYVGDNFESGYTLSVSLRHPSTDFSRFLVNKLSKHGFACIPSIQSIHCHLDNKFPTEEEAKKILKKFENELS